MKLFHNGDMRRYDGRRSLGQLEIFIDNVLNNVTIFMSKNT